MQINSGSFEGSIGVQKNEKVWKRIVQRSDNWRNVANPQTLTTIHLDVRGGKVGGEKVRDSRRSETVESGDSGRSETVESSG